MWYLIGYETIVEVGDREYIGALWAKMSKWHPDCRIEYIPTRE